MNPFEAFVNHFVILNAIHTNDIQNIYLGLRV